MLLRLKIDERDAEIINLNGALEASPSNQEGVEAADKPVKKSERAESEMSKEEDEPHYDGSETHRQISRLN